MKPWFEEGFGADYLALYPHRDAREAERAIQLVEHVTAGLQVARALDLACGAGRHSRVLAERWWTTGLDLSEALLSAAHRDGPDIPYVRGDMRVLPYADHAFDLVVNLFTSFGYFDNDAQHLRVLSEVARVTRRGGVFVLDFLNAQQVRATLVPYDERVLGNRVVQQRRTISADGRFVEKTISIPREERRYTERVRLFDQDELVMMLEESGFHVATVFGDYAGHALTADSPRTILAGVRE